MSSVSLTFRSVRSLLFFGNHWFVFVAWFVYIQPQKTNKKQQPNTEQHQVLLTLWRTIFNCFHSLQYTDIDYFSLSLSAVWVCIIFYFSVCCVPDLDYRYTTFVQKHALRYYVSGSLTWSRIKFHYFRFYLVCLTPSHNFHCRILSTAVVVVVVAVLFSLV